ncbi:hypothetical protein MXB_1497, partial [Myxobolus squamalis]
SKYALVVDDMPNLWNLINIEFSVDLEVIQNCLDSLNTLSSNPSLFNQILENLFRHLCDRASIFDKYIQILRIHLRQLQHNKISHLIQTIIKFTNIYITILNLSHKSSNFNHELFVPFSNFNTNLSLLFCEFISYDIFSTFTSLVPFKNIIVFLRTLSHDLIFESVSIKLKNSDKLFEPQCVQTSDNFPVPVAQVPFQSNIHTNYSFVKIDKAQKRSLSPITLLITILKKRLKVQKTARFERTLILKT